MEYENTVIKERLSELRTAMEKNGIDYYMIPTSDFHNSEYSADFFKSREYFCGFDGSNGTLIVSGKEAGLWTDGRYFIQAENQIKGTGVTLFKMLEPGVPTITEYLRENMKEGETLGFDGRVVPTSFGEELERKLTNNGVKLKIDRDLSEDIWTDRPSLPCHDMYVLSDELCGRSFEDKLEAVRQKMREYDAYIYILSKLDDIMWLTNLRGNDVECNPVALCYAVITGDTFTLFVQEKEVTEEVREYCRNKDIILKKYEELVSFIEGTHIVGDILLDKRNTNYLTFRILSKKAESLGVKLKNQKDPTEDMKAVKNETELKNIREVYIRDSAKLTEFI